MPVGSAPGELALCREPFGSPFIMAVRERVDDREGAEFDRALAEVERIALLLIRIRLPSAG